MTLCLFLSCQQGQQHNPVSTVQNNSPLQGVMHTRKSKPESMHTCATDLSLPSWGLMGSSDPASLGAVQTPSTAPHSLVALPQQTLQHGLAGLQLHACVIQRSQRSQVLLLNA